MIINAEYISLCLQREIDMYGCLTWCRYRCRWLPLYCIRVQLQQLRPDDALGLYCWRSLPCCPRRCQSVLWLHVIALADDSVVDITHDVTKKWALNKYTDCLRKLFCFVRHFGRCNFETNDNLHVCKFGQNRQVFVTWVAIYFRIHLCPDSAHLTCLVY